MATSKIASGSSVFSIPESSSSKSNIFQNGSARSFSMISSSSKNLNSLNHLHTMDPDEIFAKHTVHEVKSMLFRLRSDVDAKQEELRLMVGERYRDLLQTSSSIIAMSESADRVHDKIVQMHELVSQDLKLEGKRSSVAKKSKDNEDGRLQLFQSLAAHLKLLLDSPEHLWRLLESAKCLHAAWLFLLARVVHRSLVSDSEAEDGGKSWISHGIHVSEQFPLVQKQWESVAQFRSQISHKATLSLRERSLSAQSLCSSLLTLHLLDSLPLTDSLDVFLKQRTRALQLLYDSLKTTWSSSSTTISAKTHSDIWTALHSVLEVIVSTVGCARQVFQLVDGRSLVTKVLAHIQDGGVADVEVPEGLSLSTSNILGSLPSSNLYLTLPLDIRNYRPFVDINSRSTTVSTETLDSKLRNWFHDAVEHLKNTASSWLQHSSTIKDVWEVRTTSLRWVLQSKDLLKSEDIDELRRLIGLLSTTRIRDIWQTSLDKLTSTFEATTRNLVISVSDQAEGSNFDIQPSEFLLSAPPAPSVMSSSLNLSMMQSAFQRFKHGIEQRIEGMTPYLDKIMTELDTLSSALSDDIDVIIPNDGKRQQTLEKEFIEHAEQACDRILSLIQGVVEDVSGRGDVSVRRSMFGGRIAHELALNPLPGHLHCSNAYCDRFRKRSRNLYDISLRKCMQFVVLTARDQFMGVTEENPKTRSQDSSLFTPSHPSSRLTKSLLFVAESVQDFGIFDDPSRRSTIVDETLTEFIHVLIVAMREKGENADRQTLWDLRFLRAICEDRELSELALVLDELSTDLQKDNEDNSETDLKSSVFRSLSQMRLLLSPIVSPTDSSELSPEERRAKVRNAIPDVAEVDRDIQNMMNLVKPPARFGMLWVGGQGT